jgi:hypothetical protein
LRNEPRDRRRIERIDRHFSCFTGEIEKLVEAVSISRSLARRTHETENKEGSIMVRKILIGVASVAVVLGVIVSLQPATFHVERSVVVNAPAESAFAQVNDFHAWRAWSPWEKLDPQLSRTYSGPPSGTGASYAWSGNKEVGEGRMTIERSDSPAQIAIKLEFLKPFAATNTATFTFAQSAEGTKVTWAMDGKNGFVAKAMHLVMDMDKLVGKDFERGLAALKTAAEASAKSAPEAANGVK